MAKIALAMKPRETGGKGAARELRRKGMLPVSMYGGGKDPISLQVEANAVEKLLAHESLNVVLDVSIEGVGEKTLAMIKEIQSMTMTSKLVHMDLVRISMDQKVQVVVPLELINTEHLRKKAGIMQTIYNDIPVEALPDNIPDTVVLDLAGTDVGVTLFASSLVVPENVDVLLAEDEAIVTILSPKVEKAASEEGEEGEGAEGEGGEGEGDAESED